MVKLSLDSFYNFNLAICKQRSQKESLNLVKFLKIYKFNLNISWSIKFTRAKSQIITWAFQHFQNWQLWNKFWHFHYISVCYWAKPTGNARNLKWLNFSYKYPTRHAMTPKQSRAASKKWDYWVNWWAPYMVMPYFFHMHKKLEDFTRFGIRGKNLNQLIHFTKLKLL